MAAMMLQNRFAGVNPYLQSLLQTPGTDEQQSLWRPFHTQFIVYLTELLNTQLPPGYLAISEQSLQIWGESDGGVFRQRRIPDVSVYHRTRQPEILTSAAAIAAPSWQTPVEQTIEPDEFANAVLVYERVQQKVLGRLVLRMELLSPSNKAGGEHVQNYRQGRREALQGGVPLVEIDFLHEFASAIPGFPAYLEDNEAYPWYIIVSDPRPNLREGQTSVYGFRIHVPVPKVEIPLAGKHTLVFDFDTVYQETYHRNLWGNLVDYEDLSVRFETYHPDDRKRILARRDEILKQHP